VVEGGEGVRSGLLSSGNPLALGPGDDTLSNQWVAGFSCYELGLNWTDPGARYIHPGNRTLI
jgi:hypothetical protein